MSVPVLQGHLRVTLADTPTLKQIGAHNTIKTVIVKKGMTMGDAAAQLIPKISRGLSTDIKGTVDQECSSYEFYGRHQETKALIKVELEDEALDWIPTGSKGAIYKVEFRPKGEKETTSNKRQTLRVLGKPKTSLSSEDSQSAEPGDLLSFARGSQQHPKPLPDSEPRHQSVDILSFVRSGGGGSSSGGPVLDDSELDAMSFLRSKKTVGTVPPEKKKRSKYALRGKGEAPFSQSQSKLDVGKTAKAAGAVGFLSLGGDGVDGEDIFGPTEDSQETSNSKGGAMGFMDFFDRDSVPQAPISEPKSTRGGGGLSDDGQSIYFPLPTIDPKKKKEIYNTLSIASIRAQKNERDEELRSKGVPELRAATLHRMIEIFCCPPVCTEKFQRGMLLTIPTYTTPQDFLTEIIAVYDLSSLGNSNRDMREGVENLLTLWMGSYYSDFEGPEVQSLMATFLKELENNPTHQNMATFQKLNEEIKSSKLSHQQLQSQRASFGLDASGKDLNYFEAEEIADTLTFYTARIFMDLQEREHIAWMRGKKDAHPHIDLMIETFNRVSSWVSRELVIRPHLKDRVDAFEKLVLVAVRLDDKKNFQCLKALISGLNASCVRRMERTFREISADSLRKLDELTNKVSFENNFKTYRAFMETVMPPCIPFLGMFQKDFIFLNDGNPDHIGPLLNFSKRMRLAEIIGDISCCQMGNFHVNPTPQVIAYICSLPIVSEKDLHLLSRRVDPKDPEMVIAEMMEGEHELVTRVQELERKLEEANRQIEALHAKLNEKQETPSSMVAISSSQAEEKRRRQSILRKVQRNLPSDPSRWSVFDVGSWIARLVGDRWADAFIENSVLGADLVEMKLRELNLFVDDEDVSKVIYYGLKKMQEGCDPEKVLELHQNCCLVPAESDEEDGDHIRFSDESSLDFDTSLQSSLQSSGTYKLPGILDQNYQPTPPKIPPKPQSQPQPQPQPQSQLQPQLQPQPQPPQPQPQPQPRPLPANKSSSASNLKVPKPRASSFKSSGFSSSSSSFPTTTTSLGGSCSTSPPTSSRVSSPRGTSPTPIPSKTSPPASPPTSPALSSSASSSPASSSLASSPPTSSPPPSAPPRVTSVSPANPRKLPDPQVPSRRSETQSRMQPAQFSVQPPSSQTFSSIPRPSSSLTSSETTPGSPQSYRLSHSPQPARPGGPISPPPIQIGVDEQPQGKPPKVGSGVNRNSPLPVPPRGTPGNLPGSDPGVVRVAQRSNKIMVGGGGTGSGGIVRGRGISVGRGGRGRPLPQPNQQQPQ